MTRQQRICSVLEQELSPTRLEVVDDSARHAGHAGVMEAGGGTETHMKIAIASPVLKGLSRVAAHQKIYALLDDEFQSGLHALNITVLPVDA